jgi:hypothetical protein
MEPDRTDIAPGLSISRVLTGLWQIADQEKDGAPLDVERAAAALVDYVAAGFEIAQVQRHFTITRSI